MISPFQGPGDDIHGGDSGLARCCIHLAEAGHPVVGERVYRSRTRLPFLVAFPRQALHAQSLGFVHPFTGQAMNIEASLPEDLTNLVAILRSRYGRATRPGD